MSTHDQEQIAQHEDSPVRPSRRKLGLGLGAGAIFTLASRPVLALECVSPSAAASGNLSRFGGNVPPVCEGLSTTQWTDLLTPLKPTSGAGLPGGLFTLTAGGLAMYCTQPFHSVFPPAPARCNWGLNASCLDVLSKAALSEPMRPNPICAEFVATYLNIVTGKIDHTILDMPGLMSMWYEWCHTGGFKPKTGSRWNEAQIIEYCRSLQQG
mgnify:CR=1 FL=1